MPRSIRVPPAELPPEIAARGMNMYRQETVDRFEAYVCGACGYTEWFATDLTEIQAVGRLLGDASPHR